MRIDDLRGMFLWAQRWLWNADQGRDWTEAEIARAVDHYRAGVHAWESAAAISERRELKEIVMALSDHDGNTHSHLGNQDGEANRNPAGGAGLPDRGHWVGPRGALGHEAERNHAAPVTLRPGEPLALDPPVQIDHVRRGDRVKPGAIAWTPPDDFDVTAARVVAHGHIRHLLEHQPMIESQRRIMVQALGVLETLA